jgi:cytochrome c-type biogenesis protein CcmF
MLLGLLAIWIGGLAILASTAYYVRALRADLTLERAAGGGRRTPNPPTQGVGTRRPTPDAQRLTRLGRRFFFIAMGSALVAAGVLWWLILGRHYEVAYVWKVTDNALPLHFRFAAFWAEQEGTFLLWLLYGFILSTVLVRRIGKTEPYVMPFICLVQAFLFLMLTVMTPFKVVPQHPEGETVAGWHGFMEMLGLSHLHNVPTNGQGLNILLQNIWMTIHPPIMFLGFVATTIPCALALGALVRRSWDGWVKQALPWTLFAFMFLGFGKFLGGYWAYETLGWGGYWAWDPVENASFVPWLLCAALVHGLQVQQARGSWKQVNLLLAITAFLSFFYGTFLTRSGALNEFSVHSFVSPGGLPLVLLLSFLIAFCVGFWGLWLFRVAKIQSEPTYERVDERPFGFFLGIILFIGSAAIVLIGMSWPILSRTFAGKAASINYQFYNRALLPVGFFIALLMAITPLLSWRRREGAQWKPTPHLLFALVTAAALLIGTPIALYAAWRGHNDPAIYLFSAAVGLALITNVVMLARMARFGFLQTGGWVMHVGFLLCLIGVISTSRYSRDTRLVVEKGETKSLYGYNLTYEGVRPQPNGRDELAVRVQKGDLNVVTRPRSFKHGEQTFNTPYILKFWDKDLYIAPAGRMDGGGEAELTIGQTGRIEGEELLTFNQFIATGQPREDGAIVIGVSLTYTNGKRTVPLQPSYVVHPSGEVISAPVDIPGGHHSIRVAKVMPNMENRDQSKVLLSLIPKNPVDIAAFEVSSKPFVNVLWLGGYMMFLGGILTWRKRARVAAHASEHERQPAALPGEPKPGAVQPKRRRGLRPEPATMTAGNE